MSQWASPGYSCITCLAQQILRHLLYICHLVVWQLLELSQALQGKHSKCVSARKFVKCFDSKYCHINIQIYGKVSALPMTILKTGITWQSGRASVKGNSILVQSLRTTTKTDADHAIPSIRPIGFATRRATLCGLSAAPHKPMMHVMIRSCTEIWHQHRHFCCMLGFTYLDKWLKGAKASRPERVEAVGSPGHQVSAWTGMRVWARKFAACSSHLWFAGHMRFCCRLSSQIVRNWLPPCRNLELTMPVSQWKESERLHLDALPPVERTTS